MKFIKRFLILFAILLVLFAVGASIYVKVYGKSLIEQALTDALKRNVALGKVSYYFPVGLRVQDIHIEPSSKWGGFFEAEDVIAQLSPDAIYRRQFIFDSVVIVKPLVVIENIKETEDISDERVRRYGVVVPPGRSDLPTAEDSPAVEKDRDKNGQTGVAIRRLILKQGQLQYITGSTGRDFSFGLENVQLKARQLFFPLRRGRTDFNMSGRLVKEGNPLSGRAVEGYGWMDAAKKDMEARIEVVEADGSVGMTVEAVAQNNDMDVKGEVNVRNLLLGVGEQTASDASAVNDLVLNALSSSGVEIGAKFAFKTKMDNFRLDQVRFSGNVVTK